MIEMNSYALTQHVRFFPEDDAFTVESTTQPAYSDSGNPASASNVPDATDPAIINLGDVEAWEDSIEDGQTIITKKPVLGTLVDKDEITLYERLVFKFTTNSLTRYAMECFYRSSTRLTNAQAQFVPLSKLNFKGWLFLMRYHHNNELVMTHNLWVKLNVTGGIAGGDNAILKPQWTAKVLAADPNTSAFGDEDQLT